ncbi:MAG TPA: ATP-binding protein [Geothrix sp.]|nr:ATP-binding protein [Geothrix sp.]
MAVLWRTGQAPSFPTIGDAAAFLSLGMVGLALLLWPLATEQGSERLRKGLDGMIFALALGFIAWAAAVGEAFHASQLQALDRWTVMTFFFGNTAILGIVMYLGARDFNLFRGPLGWIALGMFASFFQAIIAIPIGLHGNYYVGHPVDLLILVAGLTPGLAARSPAPVKSHPVLEEARDPSLLAVLLPYLPTVTALALGIWVLTTGMGHGGLFLAWLGLAMAVLLLARQLLALLDLQRFSSTLEAKVKERTRALEETQGLLLRTQRMNLVASLGAGLAHDLNNMLHVICANAELARIRAEAGTMLTTADLVSIENTGRKAAELAQHLMSLGRQETPKEEIFDLCATVARLQPILARLAPAPVAMELDLGPKPLMIHGAPLQIEQILVNLVSNARDAMPRGGIIRIGVMEGGLGEAMLRVTDTGVGMSQELLTRIYEPFFSTKAPGRGMGLGLASVKSIADAHGGHLEVESALGQGTTFTLHLPMAEGH